MEREARLKRLRFRASHRGVREADLLIGGFFDAHHGSWDTENCAVFAAMLEEQDVDIMAWALGSAVPPERYDGDLMLRLQNLDYLKRPD